MYTKRMLCGRVAGRAIFYTKGRRFYWARASAGAPGAPLAAGPDASFADDAGLSKPSAIFVTTRFLPWRSSVVVDSSMLWGSQVGAQGLVEGT